MCESRPYAAHVQRRISANHCPSDLTQPGGARRLPNVADCTGRVLCNRFLVEELWDETAHSALFRGYHLGTDQQILIELTPPSGRVNSPVLGSVDSPPMMPGSRVLLPRQFALVNDHWPLFVYPWLEGMSLSKVLRRNGPMGPRGAITTGVGLCEALVEAGALGARLLSLPTDKLWYVPSRPKGDRVLVLGSCLEAGGEERAPQTGVFEKDSRAERARHNARELHRQSAEVAMVLCQLITDSYATGIDSERTARRALSLYLGQRKNLAEIDLALVAQLQRCCTAPPAGAAALSPRQLAASLRTIVRTLDPSLRPVGPVAAPVRCVHRPARRRAGVKWEPKVIVQQRKTA